MMRALRLLSGTLIFSNSFSVDIDSTTIGSTSLTDVDLAANLLARCARCFSRATTILSDRNHERLSDQAGDQDLPLLPECMFPALFDLSNPFHRLDRSLHQLAIVADGDISTLLEVDCSVLRTSNTPSKQRQGHETLVILTTVISFPAALRKALVHRTLRGLRFILIASVIDVEKKKAC